MSVRALALRNVKQHLLLFSVLWLLLTSLEVLIVWISENFVGGEVMQTMMESLPPFMQNLMSSQMSFASFTAAIGFGFQHPMTLMSSLALVATMATIPTSERETGFLELILTRKVARGRYLLGVLAAFVGFAVLLPLALLLGPGLVCNWWRVAIPFSGGIFSARPLRSLACC